MDAISGKWTISIIYLLSTGTRRFGQLHREMPGISQKMLTQTLRRLERDGFVKRTVYPVVPPQVDYELTPLGATLVERVSALCLWTKEHTSEVQDARASYDAVNKKASQ